MRRWLLHAALVALLFAPNPVTAGYVVTNLASDLNMGPGVFQDPDMIKSLGTHRAGGEPVLDRQQWNGVRHALQHLERRGGEAGTGPVLLLQGSADANGVVNDKNVSPDIQRRFAASYQAAGGKIQLELLPGAPHNFVNIAGANTDRALGVMKIFIGQQLAKQ